MGYLKTTALLGILCIWICPAHANGRLKIGGGYSSNGGSSAGGLAVGHNTWTTSGSENFSTGSLQGWTDGGHSGLSLQAGTTSSAFDFSTASGRGFSASGASSGAGTNVEATLYESR